MKMTNTGSSHSKYAFLEQITDYERAKHPIFSDNETIGQNMKHLANQWQGRFNPNGAYVMLSKGFRSDAEIWAETGAKDIEIWRWPGYIYVVGKLEGE